MESSECDWSVQSANSVRERAQGCEGGSAPDAARRADAVQQHAVSEPDQNEDLAFLKASKRGHKRKRSLISTRRRKIEELEPDVPSYTLEVELESQSNSSGGSGENVAEQV